MNKKINTREFREDKVAFQICWQTKQNQELHSRLGSLLYP